MKRAGLASICGAALVAAAAVQAAGAVVYEDGFGYPPGEALEKKGARMPAYEQTVTEDEKTEGAEREAVVTDEGLAVRGLRTRGNAARVGTWHEKRCARGSITVAKPLEISQDQSKTLYLGLLVRFDEGDLAGDGSKVGVRVPMTFSDSTREQETWIEGGVQVYEGAARVYAAFGSTVAGLGPAEPGRVFQVVVRLGDPDGSWNQTTEAALDPGATPPKEWVTVKEGGMPGDYRATGVELVAERANWKENPRARATIDEVRVGTSFRDVAAAR